jgi:sporulation protein YlmC with PRC-barrel domain
VIKKYKYYLKNYFVVAKMRASKIFGKEIYTTEAKRFSKVGDLLIEIDLGKYQVIGIKPEKGNNVIPYGLVKAIGDIVLINKDVVLVEAKK